MQPWSEEDSRALRGTSTETSACRAHGRQVATTKWAHYVLKLKIDKLLARTLGNDEEDDDQGPT